MRKFKYVIFIMIIIFLSGCSNKTKSDNPEKTKEKLKEEVAYMDVKIVDMLNNLNGILLQDYKITSKEIEIKQNAETLESEGKNPEAQQNSEQENGEAKKIKMSKMISGNFLENNKKEIEWTKLKSDIEIISNAWSIMLVDLNQLKLEDKYKQEFSGKLNDCITSISKEDKLESIKNLALLYSVFPQILENIDMDKDITSQKNMKANVLLAYSFANENDWDKTEDNLSKAETEFLKLQENADIATNKINGISVNLKELQNCINRKDITIFLMNYKKLIESINLL